MPDPSPTLLASGSSTTATTTPTFAAQPAGTLLILEVSSDDYRVTTGTSRPESSGWTLGQSGQDFLGAYVWYKFATGSETSVAYTIGSAAASSYVVTAWSNVDSTAGLVTSNALHTHGGASTGTTALTPAAGSRYLVLASLHAMNSSATLITGIGALSNGYTVAASRFQGAVPSESVVAGYLVLDGGTATSTSGSWTGNSQICSYGLALVFKVASGGGGTAYTGTLSASTPVVMSSMSGAVAGPTFTGMLSASTPRATSSISGATAGPVFTASLSTSTPRATSSITGIATGPVFTAALSASTPMLASSIPGDATVPSGSGALSASTPLVTSSMSGTAAGPVFTGTLGASIPVAASSISGAAAGPTFTATLVAGAPVLTTALSGTVTVPSGAATLSASVPLVVSTISGAVAAPVWAGTLSAAAPVATAAISGAVAAPSYTGTLAASTPPLTAAISGAASGDVLAARLPLLLAVIAGTVAPPAGRTVTALAAQRAHGGLAAQKSLTSLGSQQR